MFICFQKQFSSGEEDVIRLFPEYKASPVRHRAVLFLAVVLLKITQINDDLPHTIFVFNDDITLMTMMVDLDQGDIRHHFLVNKAAKSVRAGRSQ